MSIGYDKWHDAIGKSRQQKELIKQIKAAYFIQPDKDNYPDYSHRDGITKAYALNQKTRAAIEAMDKKASNQNNVSKIIDGYGQPVRRDVAVMDKRTSKGLTLHGISARIPVNMTALADTLRVVTMHLEDLDGRRANPPNELGEELKAIKNKIFVTGKPCRRNNEKRYRQYLTRVINELVDIIELASSEHNGFMAQRYKPSPAGRFYAVGLNLQNCSRLTRTAALQGCYSFDIESCHHAIVLYLAKRYGIPCKQLHYYVNNKKAFRLELANALGGEQWLPMVKEILIAIIYGAKKSEHYGVIQETLKAKGREIIFGHPRFAGLFDELQLIFNTMLENAEREPKTNLVINALSRTDNTATTNIKMIAHLLQGIESQALQGALKVHPSAIVPLHDGWICREPESFAAAEKAIHKATGIPLEVGKPERLKLSGIRG